MGDAIHADPDDGPPRTGGVDEVVQEEFNILVTGYAVRVFHTQLSLSLIIFPSTLLPSSTPSHCLQD
jgi:hypothetical protein